MQSLQSEECGADAVATTGVDVGLSLYLLVGIVAVAVIPQNASSYLVNLKG